MLRLVLVGAFVLLSTSLSGCRSDERPQEVLIRPVGNEMRYAETEFSVRVEQQVHLVFENTATAQGMIHNVVILDTTADLDRIGMAALDAAANGYVPRNEGILFNTPLAEPSKIVVVNFTAPSLPGDYPYICTFPGHYTTMRGVMHVIG